MVSKKTAAPKKKDKVAAKCGESHYIDLISTKDIKLMSLYHDASVRVEFNYKEASSHVIKSYSVKDKDRPPAVVLDYSSNGSDEDYSDDEEEGEEGYRPGGYHPVNIGDKFAAGRYVVIEKLGWGHFSTVWRCFDSKRTKETGSAEYVAMKIQKSASHYREAAIDEIELLTSIKTASLSKEVLQEYPPNFDPAVVFLLDHFDHLGKNGNHICMTFDILGENLLKVIKKYEYRGLPINIVRNYVRQICFGLDFLHRHCKIIHTDLKPENILIARTSWPDPEMVKAILDQSQNATGTGTPKATLKKGKKSPLKGSSDNPGTQPQVASSSIEQVDKTTETEKATNTAAPTAAATPLSPDQRKKMKKKLKKKRQVGRNKKDSKKHRAGHRKTRTTGATASKTAAMDSSVDKATIEMIMMERDSIPLVEKIKMQMEVAAIAEPLETHVVNTIGRREPSKYEDDDDDNGGMAAAVELNIESEHKRQNSADFKHQDGKAVEGIRELGENSAGHHHHHHHHEGEEYRADGKKESGLSVPVPVPAVLTDADISEAVQVVDRFPKWVRPTMFSYCNFDLLQLGREDFLSWSESQQRPLLFGRGVQILRDEYEFPPKSMYSKLTMVR